MDLKEFLPDYKKLDASLSELYFVRGVLRNAVHDYAEQALGAADEVLTVAKESGPMVDTYAAQNKYKTAMQRCQEATQAARMVSQGILHLEETAMDVEADKANENYKMQSMHMPKVNSMMEGAIQRMRLAVTAFPKEPRPASRCDGSVFASAVPPTISEGSEDA